MDRIELIRRVRSLTRDLTNSIFREQDIIDFLNEGIDRLKQGVPQLQGMKYLLDGQQEPNLLPKEFHHLLSVYATARCFSQDERHYQATTFMNEFEVKFEEFISKIESGEIKIVDDDGFKVTTKHDVDYVDLTPYWNISKKPPDLDEGVEGVE